VSLRVRLVSVVADDLQHAGQAAFVRGIRQRSVHSAGRDNSSCCRCGCWVLSKAMGGSGSGRNPH
jgi:hypothetical protein